MDDEKPDRTLPAGRGNRDDEDGAWRTLEAVLRSVSLAWTGHADVSMFLDEARMLVLDQRASPEDLTELAARGTFGAWATVRDCATGTAAHVLAVLEGWDRAGVAGTGSAGTPAVGSGSAWDGEAPVGQVEVTAMWCAAAVHRLGLDPSATRAWAHASLLDPLDPPDPGSVPDPHDGVSADADTDRSEDPVYRLLVQWLASAGPLRAPRCHALGLEPDRAAELLALPPSDPARRALDGPSAGGVP